jgi:hypothetical protein
MRLVLALLLVSPVVQAAGLEALAWLAGRWIGDENGAISEETWTPPSGDSMIGMWRLVSKGNARLFEFCAMTARGTEIALTLRHFKPDGTGVRDPLTLKLMKSALQEAAFEGTENGAPVRLTYKRDDRDGLTITLEKPASKQVFHFQRARL